MRAPTKRSRRTSRSGTQLDEGNEGGDEVESHVKAKRSDDDDGDDVQAHVKASKT